MRLFSIRLSAMARHMRTKSSGIAPPATIQAAILATAQPVIAPTACVPRAMLALVERLGLGLAMHALVERRIYALHDRCVQGTHCMLALTTSDTGALHMSITSELYACLTLQVRLPQRRNCLMIAPPRHVLMSRTLERIVAKFDSEKAKGTQARTQRHVVVSHDAHSLH